MKILSNNYRQMFSPAKFFAEDDGGAPDAETISQDLEAALAGDDSIQVPDPDEVDKGGNGTEGRDGKGGNDEEGSGTEGDEGKEEGEEGKGTDGKEGNGDDEEGEGNLNWVWDQMRSRLSTEEKPWDIPEEIKTGKNEKGEELNDEQKFDILVNKIYENTSLPEDEFVKSYRIASQEKDFNMQDFLQKQTQRETVMNADANSFLTSYFKTQKTEEGKQKYSDKAINDHLSKMNEIEKEEKADQLKGQIKEVNKQRMADREKEVAELREKEFNQWEESRQQNVSDVVSNMKEVEDIAGIPVTESDIQEFLPVFDKMTQFNEKTGQLHMDDYLQSNNENVFKMLYLMHKADKGGISKHVGEMKENAKKQILERTGIKPKTFQQSTQGSPGEKPPTDEDFM